MDRPCPRQVREQLGEATDVEVTRRVGEGPAARVLVDAARDAGMLVVGSRGRGGLGSLVLGSVSQQCAQHASCPVVVVHRGGVATGAGAEAQGRGRIVVGVDESQAARTALQWAVEEARLRQADVDVVHAWQPPHVSGYLTGRGSDSDHLEDQLVLVFVRTSDPSTPWGLRRPSCVLDRQSVLHRS